MRPMIVLEQKTRRFIDLTSEVRAGMLHGGEDIIAGNNNSEIHFTASLTRLHGSEGQHLKRFDGCSLRPERLLLCHT